MTTLTEREICRLKSLVIDGKEILSRQQRKQRGVDGYTDSDLERFLKWLSEQTPEAPKYANTGGLKIN